MKVDFRKFHLIMNEKFWDFFKNKSRIRILVGGAGSGKSYFEFQEIIYKMIAEPGHNYLICRKVANTNRISTYALFKQLIGDGEGGLGVETLFNINKTEMSFTVRHNGNMAVLTGLDDIEKVKSITFPSGPLTDVVIEEASEITQGDFDQLNARLRGQAPQPFQITLMLNPISNKHWIKKEFFDKRSYQETTEVFIVHSTYLDNRFIDENYEAVLQGYKHTNYEFYRVYCLGEWGNFGSVIFDNYSLQRCFYKEEDFDAIYIGMDFGSTHPSVIEKIGFKDGKMWSYNELMVGGEEHKHYKNPTNMEFIQTNREYDILKPHELCRADSAEPSRIKEWQQQDYSVIPAKKGGDSVSRGIDFIRSQEWIIDPDKCPRLAQEVEIYELQKDKDGEPIENKPVDVFDDGIKACMYALEPLSRAQGKPGTISGTLSDQKKKLLDVKKEERKKLREVKKKQQQKKRDLLRSQRKKS